MPLQIFVATYRWKSPQKMVKKRGHRFKSHSRPNKHHSNLGMYSLANTKVRGPTYTFRAKSTWYIQALLRSIIDSNKNSYLSKCSLFVTIELPFPIPLSGCWINNGADAKIVWINIEIRQKRGVYYKYTKSAPRLVSWSQV